MDLAQFDWTLYWFMFPIAMCVATTAMLSGIGGAAMFAPIFMIIFPDSSAYRILRITL